MTCCLDSQILRTNKTHLMTYRGRIQLPATTTATTASPKTLVLKEFSGDDHVFDGTIKLAGKATDTLEISLLVSTGAGWQIAIHKFGTAITLADGDNEKTFELGDGAGVKATGLSGKYYTLREILDAHLASATAVEAGDMAREDLTNYANDYAFALGLTFTNITAATTFLTTPIFVNFLFA